LDLLGCRFWWNPGDFYVVALVELDLIFFVPEVIGENCDGFDASPKTKYLSLKVPLFPQASGCIAVSFDGNRDESRKWQCREE
jgi:hypothetical protein